MSTESKFIHTADLETATRLINQGLQLVLQAGNHWTFMNDSFSKSTFTKEDKIVKNNMLYLNLSPI